ncbi:MAG TPA: hypothetical protein VKN18_32830 [Blastocatellia bacterium]|nr:hypothetical protein [Blastocatellia bacterium]
MWTKTFRTSSLFALLTAFLVLIGCAKTRAVQPVAEEPPAPPPAAAVALPAPQQPVDPTKLPAPALEHVQATVNRIFQDSVTIDSSHNPSYFVGDFNGDQSQDLAVILKPVSAKLSFLNQEFPTWIAREPLKQVLLPKSKAVANPSIARGNEDPASGQTIRFAANDALLAIVHGYGGKGWRDPEATQTHVLRDVVGDDIRMLPFASVAKAYKGIKPFPSIYGDLIQETLIGQAGFLHFAGGMYEWYDPKNYKPVLGPVHSGMSAMR